MNSVKQVFIAAARQVLPQSLTPFVDRHGTTSVLASSSSRLYLKLPRK